MPDIMPTEIALTRAQIDFAQGNVIIYVASAGGDCRANIAHGYGCHIDDDNAVVVYVDAAHAAALLTDIRSNSAIAVTFALPGAHKALQLKAAAAEIIAADTEAQNLLGDYYERIVAHIRPRGFSEAMLRAYLVPPTHPIGLRFKPYAAFDQTPGAAAGAKIEMPPC